MGIAGFIYRQLFTPPKAIPASVDLTGRTAIVTGANVGLGLETSRILIARGISRVILGVRDTSKGENARIDLARAGGSCNIEVWPIDMLSYDSIAQFVEKAHTLDRLDIVVLNAGVKKLEFAKSSYGHEISVQVNHLGTSLLSLLLLDLMKQFSSRAANDLPAHMTVVTSEMHMWTPFKEKSAAQIIERMDEQDSFNADRYPTSKLLNIFWARELATRADPSNVVINSVNPGFCLSSLHREESSSFFWFLAKVLGWTSEQGGQCIVDAVTVQGIKSHGQYLSEQKLTPPSDFVLSDEGQEIQKRLYQETIGILRKDAPQIQLPNA